jgi:hypothetical protein
LLVPSKTLTLDDPNPYPTSTACWNKKFAGI